MSVNGKFKGFVEDDLLAEAARFGIGSASDVIEQVRVAIKNWRQFADEAGVPEEETVQIEKEHLQLT
jgi:serine/threonine-protein kinase HipA